MEDFIVLGEKGERTAVVKQKFFFKTLKTFEKSFSPLSEILDCAEDAVDISWEKGEDVLVFNYHWGKSRIVVSPQIIKILGVFLLPDIIFHEENLA